MLSKKAVIAANRFGLGARPGDSALVARDPAGWLHAQLDATAQAAPAGPEGPPESAAVLRELRDLRIARALAARVQAGRGQPPQPARPRPAEPPEQDQPQPQLDRDAIREYAQFVRSRYVAQVTERHQRAIETDRPFVERLVHFWSNHFAVSADKQPIAAIAGLYEHEAIRPRVTGRFVDLLTAAERHPAMILYLDNQASMGPNSTAARTVRRNRGVELGLNENLAREILELHTLGVDGGYGQSDVIEFAKVLTGWSVGGALGGGAGGAPRRGRGPFAHDGGDPGEFHFRELMHEPGDKTVLGQRFDERGLEEGEAVLEALARHPATARHLATKLARHFVADEPPQELVERLTQTYLRNDGELTPVYRALVDAEESWQAPFAKYKTPQDFVISTYRALNQAPDDLQRAIAFLTQVGQRPYTPGSPAGWPDTAASWDGGDALLKRIEWGAAVGRAVGDRLDPVPLAEAILGPAIGGHTTMSIRAAESGGQALALLFAAPEFQRR